MILCVDSDDEMVFVAIVRWSPGWNVVMMKIVTIMMITEK